MKPQPKDRAKIAKAEESTKKTKNKLIIDLSLQNINIRLEKNKIVELINKDQTFLAYLQTFIPKNQGLDSFA